MYRFVKLREYFPVSVAHGGRFTVAIAGFALLYLAIGLWKRKRIAWLITVIVLAFSGIGHLIKGLDYEEATTSFLVMSLLIIWRNHFHALSNPPSMKHGLKVLLWAFVFTILYGTLGFYFLDHHFSNNFTLFAAFRQVFIMFFQLYNPGLVPITYFGRYFADSIYAIATITMGYSLLNLLKPFLNIRKPSIDDRFKAKTIVEKYGKSSLARFTLFDDKLFFFSKNEILISYVVKGNIALALGDPIGPEDNFDQSIEDFKEFCQKNNWVPSFYQTLDYSKQHFIKRGFRAITIGKEAIVKIDNFSIQGKNGKNLRNNLQKFQKEGYKFELLVPPIALTILDQLRVVSDEWLTAMHGREKKFSLGWFDDDYIKDCKIAIVRSSENRIIAFANLIPEYQLNEITVDLMRKTKKAPSGTMDFLFTNLIFWAKEKRYETFNLGLSPLAGTGLKSDDPMMEKFLGTIYKHFNTFYNFQGLSFFKAKYQPEWSTRYLIYPNVLSLPAIATAIVRADSGDDFILDYLKDLIARIFKKM
jgi:phosphatidylglycerol lysyltransferase